MDGQKKPAKSTFPKERLYQLQKNYRERKKAKAKQLEGDLDAAKKQIDEKNDEIVLLKLQVARFRVKLQAASCELEETRAALNFVRRFFCTGKSNFSVNFKN